MDLANRLEEFGLKVGQKRKNAIIKEAVWCDAKGNKVGWGDLEGEDLFRVSQRIGRQELFLVVKKEFCKTKDALQKDVSQRDSSKAGEEIQLLLAENCLFVVSDRMIFLIEEDGEFKTYFKVEDVWFSSMARSRIRDFLESLLP